MPTAIHTHAPQRKMESERKYKCVRVCGRKYAASFHFLATRPCWYHHLTEYGFVCLLINLTDNKDAPFRNFWPIKNADHYFLSKIAFILTLSRIFTEFVLSGLQN